MHATVGNLPAHLLTKWHANNSVNIIVTNNYIDNKKLVAFNFVAAYFNFVI